MKTTKIFISFFLFTETVIRIEDLFGNGTEAVKLWGLMLKPGVLETVLNSVNTPQVML